MKKLMILGGSRYILPVIKEAHKLGVYVITADYLPNNIAHKYSNEYVNVSIIDKEATLFEAKKRKIDGIMSFACDPGVVTAAYVADKLGLPSAGPYDSVCILQNKGRFRAFLRENGFNVPISKAYKDIDEALKDIDVFNWPVIVKPTDSAGSKGVTKVVDKNQLQAAIEHALAFSHCGEFIIEDFLLQKGFSSDCDSFSLNGKMALWGFDSQRFDKKADNPYTPAGYSWPSSISNDNLVYLKKEIQRLLTLLKLETSVFNIEVRECVNGKPYIMELTPRGGGNRLSEMMQIITGTNIIENTVRAALNMPLNLKKEKKMEGYLAEVILHSESTGFFDRLYISDDIKENVIEEDLWIKQGDKVNGFSGANEAVGTLVLKFETKEKQDIVMDNIDDYVRIIVKKELL